MRVLSGAPSTELPSLAITEDDHGGRLTFWSLLDGIAMRHLARDPGMGFHVPNTPEGVPELNLVKSGAAKLDQAFVAREFLMGDSLNSYPFCKEETVTDPVGEIMQVSKAAIGTFGEAINRLVNQVRPGFLTKKMIRISQAFTERITQKALSVKAGNRPFPSRDFKRIMDKLLAIRQGEKIDIVEWENRATEGALKKLAKLLVQGARAPFGQPLDLFGKDPATEFLKTPNQLRRIIREHGTLRFDLKDPRFSCWLE